ncbi:hypothetical protein ACFVVX_01150 [Kitasatospora sp. NPDC058170]|uniref:DUF6197 family protein n=1 Tax=Kitasatospora sp. NPDC058170 TaxID=3346364 RepID=UPI0036DA7AF7
MTTTLTGLLAMPDLAFVADGGELVREVERYLASLPAPARPPVPAPAFCALGQAPVAWDLGMTRPRTTLLDRARNRPPAPVAIDTATHLRLLSRYLTVHGWCQGQLWDQDGRRCLLGAQLAVLAAGYGTQATALDARRHLMEQFTALDRSVRSVDQWNDAPGRTPAQVHRQLDIAATRATHR